MSGDSVQDVPALSPPDLIFIFSLETLSFPCLSRGGHPTLLALLGAGHLLAASQST